MCRLLILFTVFILIGCIDSSKQDDFNKLKKELEAANATITKLENQLPSKGDIVHMVFVKMKPGNDTQVLISELRKMEKIEGLNNLQFGLFENLEDPYAMSDFDFMLQMSFASKADYAKYQKDKLHLDIIEKSKNLVAEPPISFDYLKQ